MINESTYVFANQKVLMGMRYTTGFRHSSPLPSILLPCVACRYRCSRLEKFIVRGSFLIGVWEQNIYHMQCNLLSYTRV